MDSKILFQLNEAYRQGVYEEIDGIEEWVESLIAEGYNLDGYTDDELYEAYLDEVRGGGFIPSSGTTYSHNYQSPAATRRQNHRSGKWITRQQQADSMKDAGIRSRTATGSREEIPVRNPYGTGLSPSGADSGLSMSPQKRAELAAKRAERRGDTKRGNKIRRLMNLPPMREEFDLYDVISEYLVTEGFCDSYEDAAVIMANMSEEWRESILEAFKPTGYAMGYDSPVTGKGRKARQIEKQIERLRASGNEGQADAVDFVNRMQDTPEGRMDSIKKSLRNRQKMDSRARRDAQRDSRG